MARDIAARYSRQELSAQLRETAGSPRRAPGTADVDPLLDAIVHGQDVARPLGIPRPMPLKPTIVSLDHTLTSRFHGARKRFASMRLVATDCGWSAGLATLSGSALGKVAL